MNPEADPLRRKPAAPFPFTVLTGFLGAGKTTLLNNLLRDPLLADTLVLINEFGEAGIDHLLVEKIDGDMMLMASGCVCCTIRGDLIDTLEDILRRHDNGRIKPFRRVVIETTGLADPAPVLHAIMTHPYLAMRFRLESVIAVVDAVLGAETLDRHFEAVKQAAVADRIVLTKTDLRGAPEAKAGVKALAARLHALNPGAVMLEAAAGEATASRLLDTGVYDAASKSADVRKWLNAEAFAAVLDSVRKPGPAHDLAVRSLVLTAPQPLQAGQLQLFLDMLRQLHGASLLRLKGLVALADDPARPLVVHGVQHVFHPPLRLESWPDADHATRIVLILRDLDPDHVRGLWAAFSGQPAPDRPDAAALTANPLAISPSGLLRNQ